MLDGVSKELEVVKGHNELTFNVEPSRSYTLEIKSTSDLDSNSLPSKLLLTSILIIASSTLLSKS